jgi:hypothetical protein
LDPLDPDEELPPPDEPPLRGTAEPWLPEPEDDPEDDDDEPVVPAR